MRQELKHRRAFMAGIALGVVANNIARVFAEFSTRSDATKIAYVVAAILVTGVVIHIFDDTGRLDRTLRR